MAANLVEPLIAEAGDVDSAMVLLRAADGALVQVINSRRCSFGYDQRLEAPVWSRAWPRAQASPTDAPP